MNEMASFVPLWIRAFSSRIVGSLIRRDVAVAFTGNPVPKHEKNLREHSILNCTSVIITTNHKANGSSSTSHGVISVLEQTGTGPPQPLTSIVNHADGGHLLRNIQVDDAEKQPISSAGVSRSASPTRTVDAGGPIPQCFNLRSSCTIRDGAMARNRTGLLSASKRTGSACQESGTEAG
jgi:hypothetical protein